MSPFVRHVRWKLKCHTTTSPLHQTTDSCHGGWLKIYLLVTFYGESPERNLKRCRYPSGCDSNGLCKCQKRSVQNNQAQSRLTPLQLHVSSHVALFPVSGVKLTELQTTLRHPDFLVFRKENVHRKTLSWNHIICLKCSKLFVQVKVGSFIAKTFIFQSPQRHFLRNNVKLRWKRFIKGKVARKTQSSYPGFELVSPQI